MQPCAAEVDGTLWFCGIDGLHAFEPAHLTALTCELPVKLRAVFLGDTRWAGGSALALPAGLRTLELELGTCAFDYPAEVRFRWRLLGRSPTWSEASRAHEVRLLDLPPGELVFEAECLDLEGRASAAPLRLSVTVPRRAWETVPFRILAALGLGLACWFLVGLGARRSAPRTSQLAGLVETPFADGHGRHVYHQYTILSDRRDVIQKVLSDSGIACAVYYPVPLHRQEMFAASHGDVKLPVTERTAQRCLSLPISPMLKDEQIRRIAGAIRQALA